MSPEAIAEEQRELDAMYTRLDEMRVDAQERKKDAAFSSDGTPAGRFTRDALQYRYAEELAALSAAEDKLCFGRLDTDDGESRHIGRMGLTDGTAERQQILIDWRAPAAAPFYTATALNPQGVSLRRHLRTRRRRVESVSDEYLRATDAVAEIGDLGAAGDAALLDALNAPRTGRMGDIIATIQAEQDRIIRSDRNGVMVVQGGPGTGKTVVALHRAAYLLYTYRARLGGHGVLVIGPNQTFLSYISQVLPSLGESSVVLSTIGTLFPGVVATGVDDPAVTELKGRPVLAKIIDNAVLERQRMPRTVTEVLFDRMPLRLDPSLLMRAQRRAWSTRLPHNRARVYFVRAVLDGLAKQVAGRPGVKQAEEFDIKADLGEIRKQLAGDEGVQAALADLWPPTSAQTLVGELLTSPERLAFAAPTLSPRQRELLLRKEPAAWTVADVPLLDEAAELLGEVAAADAAWARKRAEELRFAQETLEAMNQAAAGQEDSGIGFTLGMISAEDLARMNAEEQTFTSVADRAAVDREWTYGHVIVDEAQELSQMAWRMVMRRCPLKSMTVVGDVAQTSDPAGATNWERALRAHARDRWRMEELTVNYRTPEEIMTVAEPVLAAIDPALKIPESVRHSGFRPWVRSVSTADLSAEVAGAVLEELAGHAQGQVAVLVPEDADAVRSAVATAVPGTSNDAGPGHRVAVLTVREAKGLEFDAVILVEPRRILQNGAHGTGPPSGSAWCTPNRCPPCCPGWSCTTRVGPRGDRSVRSPLPGRWVRPAVVLRWFPRPSESPVGPVTSRWRCSTSPPVPGRDPVSVPGRPGGVRPAAGRRSGAAPVAGEHRVPRRSLGLRRGRSCRGRRVGVRGGGAGSGRGDRRRDRSGRPGAGDHDAPHAWQRPGRRRAGRLLLCVSPLDRGPHSVRADQAGRLDVVRAG
jgi:DNA helicase IV